MPLVLTSCTNRKRVPASRELTAATLQPGELRSVAKTWAQRLHAASPVVSVANLYCGRAFRQAQAAAEQAQAGFFVVSAGLGLLSARARVPSYSLTVVSGSEDNILSRIGGKPAASEWWHELVRCSPFGESLTKTVRDHRGAILISLSVSYLGMIADQLTALPAPDRLRLRLFTLSPKAALPAALRPYFMPYDARFDGPDTPVPGTRADFAQRALSHFAENVLSRQPECTLDEHARTVDSLLADFRPPRLPTRSKVPDPEITALIHRHWEDVQGQSSKMLRLLRDDLRIACEQARFRDLFHAAKILRCKLS